MALVLTVLQWSIKKNQPSFITELVLCNNTQPVWPGWFPIHRYCMLPLIIKGFSAFSGGA